MLCLKSNIELAHIWYIFISFTKFMVCFFFIQSNELLFVKTASWFFKTLFLRQKIVLLFNTQNVCACEYSMCI